jgi:Ca2+-binding RTX toxin-like protein
MRGAWARRAGGVAAALLATAAAFAVAGHGTGAATASLARLIIGTEKAERLVGTRRTDTIRGRGGGDALIGRARGDRLSGGSGFDTIRGGHGADFLQGGPDGAVLVGGPGRDRFNMTPDGAQLRGGGDEVIRARDGRPDAINCGHGDDVAYVDRVEDGVYDCERVVTPDSVIQP